jgi:hypothetical protein
MSTVEIDFTGLTDARNFIVQYLRDTGYAGSVEDGTALHDVVIKPMALLLTLFRAETDKSKAYLSIKQAQAIKDSLGDEYNEVVDSILSNWFVTRKEGIAAKIQVRLFFTKPPTVIQLKPTQTLTSIGALSFSPIETTTVYSTDLVAHLNPLGGTERYSTDVVLEAQQLGPLTTDPLVNTPSFTVSLPYFSVGKVLAVVNDGTLQEDSEAFIARTAQAITTRELISDRAVSTVLPDEVPEVQSVYIAGYGSPEQMRDIHVFDALTMHTGNKADLYVKTQLERLTQDIVYADASSIDLTGTGVLRVFSVTDADGAAQDFSIIGSDETLTNSLQDSYVLQLPDGEIGDTYTVDYLRAPALQAPTDFITHPDNRVGCYDPLVKEMFPVVISSSIQVRFDDPTLAVQEDVVLLLTIQAAVVSYINALPSGEAFKVSSIIALIHEQCPEVIEVITPVSCTYELLDPATKDITSGSIVSTLSLPTGMSAQVTELTTRLYTDSELLTITKV